MSKELEKLRRQAESTVQPPLVWEYVARLEAKVRRLEAELAKGAHS